MFCGYNRTTIVPSGIPSIMYPNLVLRRQNNREIKKQEENTEEKIGENPENTRAQESLLFLQSPFSRYIRYNKYVHIYERSV